MNAVETLTHSPGYEAVIQGLLHMHRLTLGGLDESAEADALRESLSDLWEGLSQAERDRVTGLSKDLYEISGDLPQPLVSENLTSEWSVLEVYLAREAGDYDLALELLRHGGNSLTSIDLFYLRGSIWREAGEMEVADIFFTYFHRLAEEQLNFLRKSQGALKTMVKGDGHGLVEQLG